MVPLSQAVLAQTSKKCQLDKLLKVTSTWTVPLEALVLAALEVAAPSALPANWPKDQLKPYSSTREMTSKVPLDSVLGSQPQYSSAKGSVAA